MFEPAKRSALITGATSGIGFAAARTLAERGWRVIVHGRSMPKAEAACAQLASQCRAPISLVAAAADLADPEQVEALAKSLVDPCPDVVVHNAIATNFSREVTPDGIELTFAVGQTAAWILTHRLCGRPREPRPRAFVWLGSQSHHGARTPIPMGASDQRLSAHQSYARTKLANAITSLSVSERWRDAGVRSLIYDPGPTHTPLMAELIERSSGVQRLALYTLLPLIGRSAAETGAGLADVVALSIGVHATALAYDREVRPARLSQRARRGVGREALFALCEEQTGLRFAAP